MRLKTVQRGAIAAALAMTLAAAMGAMLAGCSQQGDAPQLIGGPYDGVTTVAYPAPPASPAPDDCEVQDKLFGENVLDPQFLDAMSAFSYRSAATVLAEDAQANANFSPASLYYALAMTQMGAAGATRDEIADVLGASAAGLDADAVAQQCGNLLRLLAADQYSNVKLANSAWMRPDATFKPSFVDAMESQFYAALFLADFGTPETDAAMGQWIADNTQGTLTPQFKSQPEQLLSLINTAYFKSEWTSAFDASATESGTFASETGDVDASFMVQRLEKPREYRATDAYTRASLGFMDGSEMTFVLPAEGASVHDLLADADALEEALAGEATGEAYVTFRVPKFSFDSSYGLIPALEQMGMTAAFGDQADFSNLTDIPAYVSSVQQESHIGVDENGVEASAYTKVDIMEMSMLPDPSVIGELELNLDRPFLYEIRSRQGVPLFVGVCGDPSAAA